MKTNVIRYGSDDDLSNNYKRAIILLYEIAADNACTMYIMYYIRQNLVQTIYVDTII